MAAVNLGTRYEFFRADALCCRVEWVTVGACMKRPAWGFVGSLIAIAAPTSACGPGPQAFGCPDDEVRFLFDAEGCVDDCVIDFGRLQPGLSSTKRVTWSGACVDSVTASATVDDAAVFKVEPNDPLGSENFFVLLAAFPVDDQPREATLSILFHLAESPRQLHVLVNR